jgi:hypothetical protein
MIDERGRELCGEVLSSICGRAVLPAEQKHSKSFVRGCPHECWHKIGPGYADCIVQTEEARRPNYWSAVRNVDLTLH